MSHSRRLVAALIGIWIASAAMAGERDLAVLLEDVSEIAAPGVPGPLCVFGERAFVVAVGQAQDGISEAVVAAVRVGRGRAVAFGHDGYLGPEALATADTGRLMLNAIRWAGGDARDAGDEKAALRVAVHRHAGLLTYLQQSGTEAAALDGPGWTDRLHDIDVVCCSTHGLAEGEIAALRKFVRQGGGLVTAGLGWGWLQIHRGKALDEHPGNRLLASAGIVWADGYLSRTSEHGYAVADQPPPLCHAAAAIDALEAHAGGGQDHPSGELAQAVWVATRAARSIPPDDRLLKPRLLALRAAHQTEIIPTTEAPVTAGQPLQRLLLTLELDEISKLPPDRVTAHPAAESFPGPVPAGAQPVSREMSIDTRVSGWHSTGLYAPPGRQIAVEAPPEALGRRLAVRIGAHADELWNKKRWTRCPAVCREFRLDQATTRAASAFGGPIYIDVPEGCKSGSIKLRIGSGVPMPHYVLGQTELSEWRAAIRHRPAPWAELESSKVILTVPSAEVRGLEDPESVMRLWDRIADACAELSARPTERERPERFVADRQISAGYMHAGYPIMTHLDAAQVMVSVDRLRQGSWGLFHELGHNHQSRDWTFEGTGEVTVNLFTLYVYETVCGRYQESRPELFGDARRATIARHLEAGAPFDAWKRDPFLALLMYMQMKEAFGWESFQRVFAEYRELPPDQRPRSDDERRDEWLVRFSRQVGRNLGPFFDAWGVPTSEQARAAIADLPEWMPEGFPPE